MQYTGTRAARRGVLLASLALAACAPKAAPPAAVPVAAAAPTVTARGLVTDHVVVISVDGLRPDAIARYRARTMQRLMREGRYSLEARTILPSKTLPSHTSMLTGVEPGDHGITWNSDRTDERGTVEAPTVFALARAHGLGTAAFFSKAKFHHLESPSTLDHVRSPSGGVGKWSAARTVDGVEAYLATARPNLLFVHVGEPDYAGHVFGWMSWFYGRAVKAADRAVADVLAAADRAFGAGNYTVILTADHGGHGWSHGSDDPRDTTIPWVAWGEGVQAGAPLGQGIRTMDTAATALWLLGVPAPAGWDGVAVREAFEVGQVTKAGDGR